MRSLACMIVVALAACSGDKPAEIDADPAGPKCTGQLYDLCATEHDCIGQMCHLFAADGFQVCTSACTTGTDTPCIVTGGQAGTCNAMGICKPPAANSCHL